MFCSHSLIRWEICHLPYTVQTSHIDYNFPDKHGDFGITVFIK